MATLSIVLWFCQVLFCVVQCCKLLCCLVQCCAVYCRVLYSLVLVYCPVLCCDSWAHVLPPPLLSTGQEQLLVVKECVRRQLDRTLPPKQEEEERVQKYTKIQIHKYTNTQIHKYTYRKSSWLCRNVLRVNWG